MNDTASETPPNHTAAPEKRGLWTWLRRFYWMDERMAEAVRQGFGPGQPGFSDYERGQAALSSAERLRDADDLRTGRLLLLRSGVRWLARATLARAAGTSASAPAEPDRSDFDLACQAVQAAERLRELDRADRGIDLLYGEASHWFVRAHRAEPDQAEIDWERVPVIAELPQPQRQAIMALVAADVPSDLAGLTSEGSRDAVKPLDRAASALAAPLRADAGRVVRVWLSRWLRVGVSVAAVLVVVAVTVGRDPVVTGPNLALHQPVTMSSRYADGNVGHDPRALVDGDTQNLGFHTDRGGSQHVIIDLGNEHPIRRVVAYNRSDCCAAKAVPLAIEVSTDGAAYQEVAQRQRTFDVWTATFSPVPARYVKLVNSSGGYFHLAEVEVY